MIVGFRCPETERIFRGEVSSRFPSEIQATARRKLYYLHAAARLQDLAVPPGNRLERMRGDRTGQHSIRVNDQYRLCFVWRDGGAHDVELTDYHLGEAMQRLPNIHPGEVLQKDFLEPMGITAYRLARDIGVQQTRVAQIVQGRRAVSVDTAIRLGRYFGTTPQLWLNLQMQYDLEEARLQGSEVYDRIRPCRDAA